MIDSSIKQEVMKNKALIIIDAQEKIINSIKNKESILNKIIKLLSAYEILEENIYISEQNPSKLGSTIKDLLPRKDFKVLEKMSFSLVNDKLSKEFKFKGIKKLIICGFETHICIQQSVIDFLNQKYEVYIVIDAMGSRNSYDHKIGIRRMLSEGATISSCESIIFELCKTASRKEFKEISHIIKEN